MAFPEIYWAFPFTYLAMALPDHGQVALETKKVARDMGPRGPDLRHFLLPQRHLAMVGAAATRPWPFGVGWGQICVGVGALVAAHHFPKSMP